MDEDGTKPTVNVNIDYGNQGVRVGKRKRGRTRAEPKTARNGQRVHSEPKPGRGTADGDQRQAEAKAGHGDHAPPGHAGRATGAAEHQKTETGNPRPAARASEDHEPEAGRPERQERAGTTRPGHGDETKPANRAPGPEAATARTRAEERAANAPREAGRDTEKTRAEGHEDLQAASAPAAQPTATARPRVRATATAEATEGAQEGGKDREPQKPAEGPGRAGAEPGAGITARPTRRHGQSPRTRQRRQSRQRTDRGPTARDHHQATDRGKRGARGPTRKNRNRGTGARGPTRQGGRPNARQSGQRSGGRRNRRPPRRPKETGPKGATTARRGNRHETRRKPTNGRTTEQPQQPLPGGRPKRQGQPPTRTA